MIMRFTFAFIVVFSFVSAVSAYDNGYFYLAREPYIRIGLATNASSATITTSDSQLVAVSPDEPNRFLAANRVSVSARAYRPDVIEIFRLEITNLETAEQAAEIAKDVREATGEQTSFEIDARTNTWIVKIGAEKNSLEEIEEFKTKLEERGITDVSVVSENKTVVSDEAVKLSKQIASNPKSDVRSLGGGRDTVKPIVSSQPTNPSDIVLPNLREVIVNGASETAKFSSLKPVAFGSFNERAVPVKLNGKEYRGKIEVFVNSSGRLTIVNVVPLEDYLLGVVPKELSLPQIEAQKAQAVAARTYAVANINGFAKQGFDLLPTVRSQVYGGVSAETANGTRAVRETAGVVATYQGKPINALYTSTCGGRTENSGNIFEFDEPYLRGVECSLEGRRHFEPFLIKTVRPAAKLRTAENVELYRLLSFLSVNGFQMRAANVTDDFFEDPPSASELSNWLNNLAGRFGKPFPNVTENTAKPAELAKLLVSFIYPDQYADTILSESDINYQLSFDDAAEVPKTARADIALLMRDGYFTVYPDLTLRPNSRFSRAKMLRLIRQIYEKKKWMPNLQSGTAEPTADGKLVLKQGRSKKEIAVRPDVFLFRQFGDEFYPVTETALVGGETVSYQTDASGAVVYLEIKPSEQPTVAENDSPFTMWNTNLSASAVRSRLSRYVRGLGTLIDVRIASKGYSRRATALEIITTNGTHHLKGGKIRSALRLREQLFVMNKRYGSDGRVQSISFTGRGWGHGVGMCQYGAFGLAKMGLKYEQILKHYYTGIDLTKSY